MEGKVERYAAIGTFRGILSMQFPSKYAVQEFMCDTQRKIHVFPGFHI
jgi:hypothetical protein